jgi:type IX secretion system PorP/SprF family membrane protein
MKIKHTITFLLLIVVMSVKAQDPIFTQYFMVPETINPGFTGFLETTNTGVLHRTQWPNLDFRVDTDFGFFNTWREEMNSGFGVTLMNHRENFTNYSFSQANFTYAYRVQLNDDWYFRPAIEAGFGNKSFGFQNLILEDQININNATINPTSIDPLRLREKVNFFDLSAGMLFNNENTWFGATLKHLNKPNISFSQTGNLPLEMFFSANAGLEFKLADYIDIINLPYETKMLLTTNFMKQGDYSRLDLGTGIIFKKLFFGVTAATNPVKNAGNSHFLTSLNAFGGLQYEHFKFGYSYDFNTSKIGRTGGVYELSVTYQFDLNVHCLGCPQYY